MKKAEQKEKESRWILKPFAVLVSPNVFEHRLTGAELAVYVWKCRSVEYSPEQIVQGSLMTIQEVEEAIASLTEKGILS